MQIRTVGVLVAIAALGVHAQGPQERNPVVPPDVATQAAARGAVPVIVGLRMPAPASDLSGADALAVQRAAVRRSLDDFAARATAEGMSIGHRLQNLPFVSMRVTADQLKQLSAMPGVESIREDAVDRIMLAQSVPLVGAPAAWAAGSTGAGWTVALLDTGVDTAHPFLAGKVTGEACFSNAGGAGGGTSLCPDGGTSATGTGSGINCDPAIAGCDHGTHLAGIIAGANGPGGMSGVAPGANLISIQVFTRGDDATLCGTDRQTPCLVSFASDQASALDHVLTLAGPANSNRIAAVNLSLGGGHYTDHLGCVALNPSRAAGIESLRTIGIASVAAAGNDGYTNALAAPACLTQLAIPASTKSDRMSAFSNRSSTPIVAPGEAINSSVPGGLYVARSGTSQAAAHVSGAVAVLKQALPAMTVSQAFVALSASGNNIFDPLTNATYFRLRVDQARTLLLGGAADVPGVPGRPTAFVSGGAVTLSWTPPASGGAVTRYIIEAGTYSGGSNIGSFTVGLTTTVAAAPGAGLYYVRVRASNNSGIGDPSPETFFSIGSAVTPPGTPGPLTAAVSGASVTLSWSPPTFGAPPTHYLLQAGLSPGDYSLASIDVGNVTSFTAVPPPGIYYVRVRAVNDAGPSTYAAATQFAIGNTGRPGAPGTPVATVNGPLVTVSWTPPATGSAPTSYLIAAGSSSGQADYGVFPVGNTTTITAAPGGGTYFIRVVGVNGFGAGLPSTEIAFTIGGPGAGAIDGTWNGQTSLGQSVALVVSGGVIRQVLVGNAVGSCVRYRNDGGLSVGVSGGTFTRTQPAGPGGDGYTLNGAFTSASAASGTLASVMTAGSCGGNSTATWTATNSGVGKPILPLPPTALNASPGPSSAGFWWIRPDPAGGEAASYDLEIGSSAGARNVAVLSSTETSTTGSGLAPGTYFARVRARNLSGASRASNEVNFTVTAAAPSYVGTWAGTTNQGRPISFVIARVGNADVVTSVTFAFTINGSGGCVLDDQTSHSPNSPVSGNQMTIARLVDPPTFQGYGLFDTPTTVSGNLYVTTALSSPCVGSVALTWTATKQ